MIEKFVVVGAGPVGSLAALYAARRGYDVEIYEYRDLRDPKTIPLNFTKSINLALSVRGIHAMEQAGIDPGLVKGSLPMRGRMIHGRRKGQLYEESQIYDIHGRAIYAIDRADLNRKLLHIIQDMPNVKFFFNHKLTGADFKKRRAWFEVHSTTSSGVRPDEIEVGFDFLIGADGAHSAVRYHLTKYNFMNYSQQYIDTLWCEFKIQPNRYANPEIPRSEFRISPEHLHIWPGKKFMFIAIPSEDGSFVCTLFLPRAVFRELEAYPSTLTNFFDEHFPGVTQHIPPDELDYYFKVNPHLPLVSVKCDPYHYSSTAVIIGDAAHAMVPFYGQGMNAGLEDVRVLFEILDEYDPRVLDEKGHLLNEASAKEKRVQRAIALENYSKTRVVDAHTINDLALQNYEEMRSDVLSWTYRFRKNTEEWLSKYLPALGWRTKYSRVSFSNERYSDVFARSEHQGRVLMTLLKAGGAVPVGLGMLGIYLRKNPTVPPLSR